MSTMRATLDYEGFAHVTGRLLSIRIPATLAATVGIVLASVVQAPMGNASVTPVKIRAHGSIGTTKALSTKFTVALTRRGAGAVKGRLVVMEPKVGRRRPTFKSTTVPSLNTNGNEVELTVPGTLDKEPGF